MSGLSAFFSQNALKAENEKYVVSKRFLDEDKNPMEWEIQAITEAVNEALRKECTRKVPVPGKKNMFQSEMNHDKYLGKLAARCTVYPNLNDAELQNSYGIMGADELLKEMLTSGEYANYLEKVQETNGFDTTTQDLVEQAKN